MSVVEKIMSWFMSADAARKVSDSSIDTIKILETVHKHIKDAANKGQYVACFDVDHLAHAAYQSVLPSLVKLGYTVRYWDDAQDLCMRYTVQWFPERYDQPVKVQRPDFGFKYEELQADIADSKREHEFEANVPAYIKKLLYALTTNASVNFTLNNSVHNMEIINHINKVLRYKAYDIITDTYYIQFKVKLS